MPRHTDPLTAAGIRAAKWEGRDVKLFDGAGLHLVVRRTSKLWRLKYHFFGREKLLSLGIYPAMTLAQARKAAQAARDLLPDTDPSRARWEKATAQQIAQDNTLATVALEWYEEVHRHRVVASHAERNWRRLQLHAFPRLGHVPVDRLDAPRLLLCLREVEQQGREETAHRVRALVGQILRYAVQTGRAERNPVPELRDAMRSPAVRHHAAIVDPVALAGLLRAIDGYAGQPPARAALKLLPILFCRPGELRTATWDTFDLPAAIWNYTPSKGGGPMVTPLPDEAVAILRELHTLTGPEGYVFPSIRGNGRPMSMNTMRAALNTLGFRDAQTAHGFRATARTLLVEGLDFPPEVVEMQLGHAVKDPLGRSYNRTTFLAQRRLMLETWSHYLLDLRDGVVALPARKAMG